jgi:phytoene dehydrogenase-like protein
VAKHDVVVIGAGAAGLAAAGLLAKEGKDVLLLERAPWLGGRAMMVPDEGFRIQIGSHLVEDTGSGIMKIAEYLGKSIGIGPISSDMPVWDHETESWGSIRDRYSGSNRQELKKVIQALIDTPYEEFDNWDDKPLRPWLYQHTDDQGVVDLFEFLAVLECLTDNWYDHSASENLYVRKLHYQEKQKGGFSFWPEGGWDTIWQDLADALVEHGGQYRTDTSVSRVVIEGSEVKGVMIPREPRILPNEIFEEEFIEASCVISTLPVWHVLDVVPEEALPDWYAAQIKFLAQEKFRVSWVGLHIATEEQCPVIDPMELCTWLHAPQSRLPGFLFEQTAMDPDTAPPGVHLYTMGGVIPGERARDEAYLREMFDLFEADMTQMHPCFASSVWRRRHLVFEPGFGVISKPGLVGRYRPHWRAPNVDGLYFASETFRSRMIGTDRAARAALTVVEEYLGRRLWPIEDSWRY